MLRNILYSFLCLFSYFPLLGQPQVIATWPVGDPICYLSFLSNGGYKVDSTGEALMAFYRQGNSAAFGGTDSNVFFQFSGTKIVNSQLGLIENGDGLADNLFNQAMDGAGTSLIQSVLVIPKSDKVYWLFYYSYTDSLWDTGNGSPDRLYFAIIDMNANGGSGKVIRKKEAIYKGVMGDCRLTAVRHGNGRDWWLVNHGYANNVYNKFLVSSDTVIGPYTQQIGSIDAEPDLMGSAQFSLDGTKYASGTTGSSMNLMDFDRCSGEFFNLQSIGVYSESPWSPAPSIVTNLCFSASGRYLYITTLRYILQYDTWSDAVDTTRTLIVKIDSTYGNTDPFFLMSLTPHNKIIVSNFQGFPLYDNYHTIEFPDSAGLACNFQKNSLHIESSWANVCLPNLINIKLGALSGSICDTVTTSIENLISPSIHVQTFPNPASNLIFLETNKLSGNCSLSVTNTLGCTYYNNQNFDGATVIKVNEWQNGVYFWNLLDDRGKSTYGKFVVQH